MHGSAWTTMRTKECFSSCHRYLQSLQGPSLTWDPATDIQLMTTEDSSDIHVDMFLTRFYQAHQVKIYCNDASVEAIISFRR